jgi:hypothetical protein
MIQKIPDVTGRICTVLWDTGAQISLVTHQYATEAGFKGRPASIQISGVGAGNKNKSRVQYRVLLKKRDGKVAEFTLYGVERITGDAVGINLEKAKFLFPAATGRMESPEGSIHMLVSMDHMKDAPKEQAKQEGIVLYSSEFGTRYVACGNMGKLAGEKKAASTELKVLSCRSTLFHPPEFIRAEAMGKSSPGDVLLVRTAKNVNFGWIACCSRKTLSTR